MEKDLNTRHLANGLPVCHTFAVTTLADWYGQNLDVAHLPPALSTYLGHVSPATTYWYLQACPLRMTAAAQRLESFWSRAS